MKNFLRKIQYQIKNKYQRSLYDKELINIRYLTYKKILQLKTNFKKEKIYQNKFDNSKTSKFIFKNLLTKKNNKALNDLIRYYEKFSYSLKLKKSYNKKMIKKTNKNVHFSTYIFLGNHIIELKELDELQKLNCILKINDITLSSIKDFSKINLISYIKKNINYEINLIYKYAKKSVDNSG